MNWEEKALCIPPFHGVNPLWFLGVKRPLQFFSAAMEVISCPCTLCVFISSTQNTLSEQGVLRLCSSGRSECRSESLIKGGEFQQVVCFPLLWSDAWILASVLVVSPSLHAPKEKLHLSATGTWSWQHLQNTDHKLSKTSLSRRKISKLRLSRLHVRAEQSKPNSTYIQLSL